LLCQAASASGIPNKANFIQHGHSSQSKVLSALLEFVVCPSIFDPFS
jgi:hypothetical protein